MRAEEMSLSQLAEWYFTLSQRWPETFDDYRLAQYWSWSRLIATEDNEKFVSCLRAGALKLLRKHVGACVACPLNQFRLAGRPVMDDCSYTNDPFVGVKFPDLAAPVGATTAKIMMVAEGPGQFEQRTGNPFVTYQVLAGSMCATECGSYELCYSPASQMPQQPCKPTSLRKRFAPEDEEYGLLQVRTTRAEAPKFPIMTVAGFLDNALTKAGLWRESWNSRQTYRKGQPDDALPRPGSIYLTNMVKCRSCKPRDNGNGFEDISPSKENMTACSPWLDMQVYIVQPKVIVAMGNPAIMGLVGIDEPKVLKMRGNAYPGRHGLPVLVEVHPSFISRQDVEGREQYLSHFVETLNKAKGIAEGTYTLPWMTSSSTIDIPEDMEFPSPTDMQFTSTF